jgi:hypothetical protein
MKRLISLEFLCAVFILGASHGYAAAPNPIVKPSELEQRRAEYHDRLNTAVEQIKAEYDRKLDAATTPITQGYAKELEKLKQKAFDNKDARQVVLVENEIDQVKRSQIKPGQRQEIQLTAPQGKVKGNIRLCGNGVLGYWYDPKGEVSWNSLELDPGTYAVDVTYGCANDGGGRFQIVIDNQSLNGKAESTGSWKNLQRRSVGEITVVNRKTTVRVLTVAINGHALWDLRSVVLKRVK